MLENPKLTAIIIDDEFHGRENLRILVENFCPQVAVLHTFEYPKEAYNFLKYATVDLVFLDIGMPEIDGVEFVELFPDKQFQVIFVTAYEDFAIRAIKLGVLDYIVKPISVEELKKAVSRVVDLRLQLKSTNSEEVNQKVSISTSKGTEIVEISDVVFLESDTYLSYIYLSSTEKIIVSKTLKYFEEALPSDIFYRVHRSYLINLNFIESYSTFDGGTVKLKGITLPIPISRRNKVDFFNKMKTFTI